MSTPLTPDLIKLALSYGLLDEGSSLSALEASLQNLNTKEASEKVAGGVVPGFDLLKTLGLAASALAVGGGLGSAAIARKGKSDVEAQDEVFADKDRQIAHLRAATEKLKQIA